MLREVNRLSGTQSALPAPYPTAVASYLAPVSRPSHDLPWGMGSTLECWIVTLNVELWTWIWRGYNAILLDPSQLMSASVHCPRGRAFRSIQSLEGPVAWKTPSRHSNMIFIWWRTGSTSTNPWVILTFHLRLRGQSRDLSINEYKMSVDWNKKFRYLSRCLQVLGDERDR